MMIVDFECDTPIDDEIDQTLALIRAGRGYDKEGYGQMSGPRWAQRLGISAEEFAERKEREGLTNLALEVCEKSRAEVMSEDAIIAMLDDAGVRHACVGNAGRRASNRAVAELARRHPDRLIPWFRIWGDDGDAGRARLERGIAEEGCRGLEISCYREGRSIDDPVYEPLFEICLAHDVPVRITTGLHLLSDRPHDLAHPRHLDAIATRHPRLKIVAGLAGWPWTLELCAIAMRHAHLYIDIACRRAAQLVQPGAGYEALIALGATPPLSRKILYGSGWGSIGVTLRQSVEEALALPLPDDIKRLWMGENAARLLNLN